MIDLTPLEVRQKKGDFRRAMRGYDPELVNDFLDLVADRMEELVKENMVLRDRVEALQEELSGFQDKEKALSDALMAAQELREDARSHAEKEGELMLREARLAAEQARQEATQAQAREEDALRQVRARRAQLVESFRRLLQKELGELEVIEETLELRGSAGPAPGPKRQHLEVGPFAALPPDEEEPAPGSPAGDETAEGAPEAEDPMADEGSSQEAGPEADEERRRSAQTVGEGPTPEDGSGGIDPETDDFQEDWLSSLVEEE